MTNPEPRADKPVMPEGYGVKPGEGDLLPWSWAEERLTAADNFWFSTARPDGRPHAMPAWGVWLDGGLYFEVARRRVAPVTWRRTPTSASTSKTALRS